EVLHPQGGVLYKSGVYAPTGGRLTTGDLVCVLGRGGPRQLTRRGGNSSDSARGVSRRHSTGGHAGKARTVVKGSSLRPVVPHARPGLRVALESGRRTPWHRLK